MERRGFGFVLVELVIVLAVIMILLMTSYKNYMFLRKKALAVEAKMALTTIRKMEKAYFQENNRYTTDLNVLGFQMMGHARYTYAVTIADGSGFTARAEGNIDSDPDLDVWEGDAEGRLWHANSD